MFPSASTKSTTPVMRIDPLFGLIKTRGLVIELTLNRGNREVIVSEMGDAA
ncbi:MAG: hypothetical protein RIS05_1152 [Actinomycetota bacterium]